MTNELWASAKALYFEACQAPNGYQVFLDSRKDVGEEIIRIVRELLSADCDLSPQLDRPCWVPCCEQPQRHALELGQVLLSRFEIVGFLGSGGMGEVYRAFDHQQSIFIALKTLREALAADPGALESLRNELNLARLVTSPYVCRLYESHWPSEVDTHPFFTMELLEGETLSHYLLRETVQPGNAMPLAEQMIAALEAAHSKGIVHRDFKSGNVMLMENGSRAVVMDFGLAREIVPGTSLETTLASNAFAGTPAYMAPEQLRGLRATFASDIHALGVVMFEMLTGHLPFEGDGPLEIAAKRLSEDAPSPRRHAPRLDRRWEYTILRCLEADPKRRPPSVSTVHEMLQKAPPFIWHRRGILAAVLLTVPALATIESSWESVQRRRTASVDVFDIENLSGEPGLDFLCRGTTSELIRRFTQSGNISAIPMRMTLRGRNTPKGRLAISGALSKERNTSRLEILISEGTTVLWASVYGQDRFADQLRLQAEIASDASTQLLRHARMSRRGILAQWLPAGQTGEGGAPTRNSAAFDSYMRGSSLQQEYTEASLRAAISYFERAVDRDPHFALALASLADCHLSLLNFGFDFDSAVASKARDFAQHAIREDPLLPEAHAVLGAVHQLDWDWSSAEAEFDRAIQLKPDFAKAIRWRAGLVLQFARFDEAIAGMEKAFRIDPYDRGAVGSYGVALIFAGRFQEATDMLTREIGSRDMVSARYNLALAQALLAKRRGGAAAPSPYAGALQQARTIASIERRSESAGSEVSDRLYALVYSMMGRNDLAAPYLERLEQNVSLRRSSPGANATVYVAQHRLDEAQDALERAMVLRDRFVLYLRVNVLLEELRGQPRFETLLGTLRLK